MCNEKSFERDLRAYFPYDTLTEYDFKRVVEMFNRHKEPEPTGNTPPEVVTKIVYKEAPPKIEKNICPKCQKMQVTNLGPTEDNNKYLIPFERIEIVVCAFFELNPEELRTAKRGRKISMARHFIFFFARRYTVMTLGAMGEPYGNMHHTSVAKGDEKIKNLLENDSHTIYAISLIEEYLVSDRKDTKNIETIDLPEYNHRNKKNKKQAA